MKFCKALFNRSLPSTVFRTLFIIYSNHRGSVGRQVFQNILSNLKKPKKTLKKLQIETIKLIPRHITLDNVDSWFQDEAKIGQQNTSIHLCMIKG
jgi:hypothetical protein